MAGFLVFVAIVVGVIIAARYVKQKKSERSVELLKNSDAFSVVKQIEEALTNAGFYFSGEPFIMGFPDNDARASHNIFSASGIIGGVERCNQCKKWYRTFGN